MSRVGKKPIAIPPGVEVKLGVGEITVKGPKGALTEKVHPLVKLELKDNQVLVTVDNQENKQERAFWGLFRQLIANMVSGVTAGFEKKLEINGVGYKVALQGNTLVLNLGFSHPIKFSLPQGVSAIVENNTITLVGVNKQLVGELAANIRKLRKPEPYKGKGIKYAGEVIRRKAGKAAKAGA